MSTYTTYTSPSGSEYIARTDEDGRVWNIPNDPANSDYQAYLAAQSTPSLQLMVVSLYGADTTRRYKG